MITKLPPTPNIQEFWDDIFVETPTTDVEVDGNTESEEEDEPEDHDGESMESENEKYNPEGKGEDLPPCSKFGHEGTSPGPESCKVRKWIIDGQDLPFTMALAELDNREPKRKRKSDASASSGTTLRTPPSTKPCFFGKAVVDTPEKVSEPHSDDDKAGP